MDLESGEDLTRTFRTVSIIYYCISAAVLLYGGLAFFLVEKDIVTGGQDLNKEAWRSVFLFISIAGLIAAGRIRHFMLRRTAVDGRPEQNIVARLARSSIIACGFCEVPAVLGLVMVLLTADINEFYLFALIAFAGLVMNFPKIDQWRRYCPESVS